MSIQKKTEKQLEKGRDVYTLLLYIYDKTIYNINV